MTRQETLRRRLETLFATHEALITAAFLLAIRDLVSAVELNAVVRHLERGDIQPAVDALNMDASAFRAFDLAIMGAYEAGGSATVSKLTPCGRRASRGGG